MPTIDLANLEATHESVLVLNYSQYIIYGAATLAVAWGGWKAHQINKIKVEQEKLEPEPPKKDQDE